MPSIKNRPTSEKNRLIALVNTMTDEEKRAPPAKNTLASLKNTMTDEDRKKEIFILSFNHSLNHSFSTKPLL